MVIAESSVGFMSGGVLVALAVTTAVFVLIHGAMLAILRKRIGDIETAASMSPCLSQEIAAQNSSSESPEKWFEVGSAEDLRRKIAAGSVILRRESKSDFWTPRQKDDFEKAAAYVDAAEDVIRRAISH